MLRDTLDFRKPFGDLVDAARLLLLALKNAANSHARRAGTCLSRTRRSSGLSSIRSYRIKNNDSLHHYLR